MFSFKKDSNFETDITHTFVCSSWLKNKNIEKTE